MLVGANDLPELAPADEQEVAAVVGEVRKASDTVLSVWVGHPDPRFGKDVEAACVLLS
jgi:hypothetical protein